MIYSWGGLEHFLYHLAEQDDKTTLIMRCQGFFNNDFNFSIFVLDQDNTEKEIGHVVISSSKLIYTPTPSGGIKITFLD
jgi:hypothetical protein